MSKGWIEDVLGLGDPSGNEDMAYETNVCYVAKLAPSSHPGWGVLDKNKTGVIPVEFGGKYWQARPMSQNYRIISKEFAIKYRDSVGIIVEFLQGDFTQLVWSRFLFFKDKQPFGVGAKYPDQDILYFDETLVLLRDRKSNNVELKLNPDDPTLTVKVDNTSGVSIKTKGDVTLETDGKVLLGKGGAAEHIVTWEQLKPWLKSHTHIGNMGAPTMLSPISNTQLDEPPTGTVKVDKKVHAGNY